MGSVKDMGARAVNYVHRTLVRTSGSKLGGTVMGMPTLDLVTTGRKSGEPRHSMLTAPIVEGERIVLVASYGGSPNGSPAPPRRRPPSGSSRQSSTSGMLLSGALSTP